MAQIARLIPALTDSEKLTVAKLACGQVAGETLYTQSEVNRLIERVVYDCTHRTKERGQGLILTLDSVRVR